jgi:hypothetical protein
LFSLSAPRVLTVVVDYRNVNALFPSMPENMQRLIEQQLQLVDDPIPLGRDGPK